MRAVMYGADHIAAGSADFVLAGGLESMTNAPYLLPKARAGLSHGSRRNPRPHVLRRTAEPLGRQAHGLLCRLDSCEIRFHARATGRLCRRIGSPCALPQSNPGPSRPRSQRSRSRTAKASASSTRDETPFTVSVEKIPSLKPAFGKDGTVTAASSSSIADGAVGPPPCPGKRGCESRLQTRSRASLRTRATRKNPSGSRSLPSVRSRAP